MTDKCETCRFWQPNLSHPRPVTGECHCRAPQVTNDVDGETSLWPYTLNIDWCGEHKPKPIHKPDDTEGNQK